MNVGTSGYPTYRSSRHPWIAKVPEHWLEHRTKVTFREVDERSEEGKEELLSVSHMTGVTPRSQKNVTMFKAESYEGHKLCRPGDVVINTMWAWMGALGESRHTGIVSPAYGVYRPHQKDAFARGYLDYLLRTQTYVAEYICRSTGIQSSRLRLYPDKFLCIPLLQPPVDEQRRIVGYLRAQDRQIAKLIYGKRRLIELLSEQKQTIIHRAVTRGLNPDVLLKPSGINWLGNVPAHWEVRPLKYWAYINQRSLKEGTPEDYRFKYVDIGTVGTRRLVREPEEVIFANAPSRARRIVRQYDTILSTVRTYLRAVYFFRDEVINVIASTGFAVLTPRPGVHPEFLSLVIQGNVFIDRVTANSVGIAYPAIAETVLGAFHIPMPPDRNEQEAIVESIERDLAPVDAALGKVEREVKLIREYRDRLISDVVTGQIDVRGWQPSADESVDEDETAQVFADTEEGEEVEEADGDN